MCISLIEAASRTRIHLANYSDSSREDLSYQCTSPQVLSVRCNIARVSRTCRRTFQLCLCVIFQRLPCLLCAPFLADSAHILSRSVRICASLSKESSSEKLFSRENYADGVSEIDSDTLSYSNVSDVFVFYGRFGVDV